MSALSQVSGSFLDDRVLLQLVAAHGLLMGELTSAAGCAYKSCNMMLADVQVGNKFAMYIGELSAHAMYKQNEPCT